MSGEQLNLDAIEKAARHDVGEPMFRGYPRDVLALIAEVRRLRARFRLCEGCDATLVRCNEHIEAGAIKCCPDCKHPERP